MHCHRLSLAVCFVLMTGVQPPALAEVPAAPCDLGLPTANSALPAAIEISARSLQPQRGWQRQGRDIEITVRSPKIPNKDATAKVFVCVRWQLAEENTLDVAPYRRFVMSGSTGGAIKVAKDQELKITAVVPKDLPGVPQSSRALHKDPKLPFGDYAKDNAFPLADIRVLIFGEGETLLIDQVSEFGVIAADTYCNIPLSGTTVDSGVGKLGAYKNWQPENGEFEFTVDAAPKSIPATALVKVCYRWKLLSGHGDPGPFHEAPRIHMVDRQTQSVKIAATVRQIPDPPLRYLMDAKDASSDRVGAFAIPVVNVVPQADTRILIIDSDGSPVADVMTTVGITSVGFAAIIVVLTIVMAFLILWLIAMRRLAILRKCNPILSVITTRNGYASLSQFQIILWTFVVLGSAAYVMALSGDLIEITSGTLVLLGISGSATVIAKAKSETDARAEAPQPDVAAAAATASAARQEAIKARSTANLTSGAAKADAEAAAAEAEARAAAANAKSLAADAVALAQQKRAAVVNAADKAAAEKEASDAEANAQNKLKDAARADEDAKTATRQRHPSWSDLVMEEVQGRELDVTRIQMLYFTLVTAVFVVLKVVTSYEIPVIPEGFLLLMGISNSVYIGSKFAAGSTTRQ